MQWHHFLRFAAGLGFGALGLYSQRTLDQNPAPKTRRFVEMPRLTCAFCKEPLSTPGGRCRACGWARDYNPGMQQRTRAMTIVAIVLSVAVLALLTEILAELLS